ncbi:Thiol-disulfide isomerase or thioredoxin [bacterium A37T11]|nr:Thiol-disulfide isomerase or thioredoxin [bacterium A37T11]
MKFGLLVSLLLFGCYGYAQVRGFQPGMQAPDLRGVRWLHGEGMDTLEKGRVYLVEFTHTDCLPCRMAIPHLNGLERQYAGKLKVVSIYSYFPSDRMTEEIYRDKIRGVMHAMVGKMDYTIGLDQRGQQVRKKWDPWTQGFPSIFIVDQAGRMLWKGGFSEGLDTALARVVHGSLDAVAQRQQQHDLQAGLMRSYFLRQQKQLPKAMDVLDSLLARFADDQQRIAFFRFRLLATEDAARANRVMESLLAQDPGFHYGLEEFGNKASLPLDIRLGTELANRVLAFTPDPLIRAKALESLASLYAKHGLGALAEAMRSSGL